MAPIKASLARAIGAPNLEHHEATDHAENYSNPDHDPVHYSGQHILFLRDHDEAQDHCQVARKLSQYPGPET
jgi:hypothetical protein